MLVLVITLKDRIFSTIFKNVTQSVSSYIKQRSLSLLCKCLKYFVMLVEYVLWL